MKLLSIILLLSSNAYATLHYHDQVRVKKPYPKLIAADMEFYNNPVGQVYRLEGKCDNDNERLYIIVFPSLPLANLQICENNLELVK